MSIERQQHGPGFVRQELHGDTPIVRVGMVIGVEYYEDVAPLNGGGFEAALVMAARRAVGYPEDAWVLQESIVQFPDEIDLFACLREGCFYNGAKVTLTDPEGGKRTAIFTTDFPYGGCKSLWIAHACARIFTEYYAAKGVEARPFRPAKEG
jgi:hypothetical protein